MRPDDILALQAVAGNRAVVQWLGRGVTPRPGGDAQLMRQPVPLKESPALKSAANKVAALAGISVDNVLSEFAFNVQHVGNEAGLIRAATSVAGLAGKSGAGLYSATLKMPAADAEAHWVIALLVEATHPQLATAIRLARDYRLEVWFDIADVISRDAGAAKLFFEALSPAEAEKVWAVVQQQDQLAPSARTKANEIVEAIQAKASKTDIEATAKLMAPTAGVSVGAMREDLEIIATVGFKAADLRRLAPSVLRLVKLKWGAPLYEALLQVVPADLETLLVLVKRLGDKYARFGIATDLVFGYRTGTWFTFAKVVEEDPYAAKLLLDTLPPAELGDVWAALDKAGLDKRKRDQLRGQLEVAMHDAAKGDSERADAERYRGRELGQALEKRVDTVLTNTDYRISEMVDNISRGVSHVDTTLSGLLTVAERYKKARDRVEETIKRAESSAKLDQEKMDYLLGIAIGVGVGLGLGVAVPLAESASRAVTAGLDAVGEVYEAKVADVIKGGDGAGGKASGDYERADPQLKQTEAYKSCGELYRQLASLGPRIKKVSAVSGVGARVKADARELATVGSHSTLVIPQLERMVDTLQRADNEMKRAASEVFDLALTLHAEAASVQREAKNGDQLRMEKQIWIHWLGSRSGDEAELAGKEPVKGVLRAHHLVAEDDEDSSIGWGVGSWHSDDNSRTGAEKAAAYSQALSLAGRAGMLTEGQPRELATMAQTSPNAISTSKQMGMVGKATIEGLKDSYSVEVLGPANPGDDIVITGVVGREDRELYPAGDDKGKLGIVLSARRKPKTAREAVTSLADDYEPAHAI